MEESIYGEMVRKMATFQTLTGGTSTKTNPKLTALQIELTQLEGEIESLLNTLTGANATLLSYVNTKIEELDAKRQRLTNAIADMTVRTMSADQMERISNHLNNWDMVSFDDRRTVTDSLITRIEATSESVQIEWKI